MNSNIILILDLSISSKFNTSTNFVEFEMYVQNVISAAKSFINKLSCLSGSEGKKQQSQLNRNGLNLAIIYADTNALETILPLR
jgi:hypothetical protein